MLFLSDDDQIITAVAPDAPIGHSDHLVIKFKLALETRKTVSISAPRTAR